MLLEKHSRNVQRWRNKYITLRLLEKDLIGFIGIFVEWQKESKASVSLFGKAVFPRLVMLPAKYVYPFLWHGALR